MQQLTKAQLKGAWCDTGDCAIIDLPLPSEANAERWCIEVAQLLGGEISLFERGADRCQARVRIESEHYWLHIEWLSESIWLSPEFSKQDLPIIL